MAVGTAKLGLAERPKELSVKQAAAAVGQCELMHIYDKMFLEYGINVAQILLTRENIVDDDQRANIHNTFTALTKIGVVPIINENDTVATAELKHIENFGDNDTLSAVVARIVRCRSAGYLLGYRRPVRLQPAHQPAGQAD